MRAFTNNFYGKAAWKKCRASFIAERIAIDGGRCQMCGEEQGEIVHHVQEITPETIEDVNVILNHDNLRYLCRACHGKVHGQEQSTIMPDGSRVTLPYRF